MLKKAMPTIANFVQENKVTREKYSEVEKMYLQKHAVKPRTARTDLKTGDLVVVLEGKYSGNKTVFLKQTENNMAVVSGVYDLNGVGIFQIDERYLFKLSVNITMEVPKIPSKLYEARKDVLEDEEADYDSKVEAAIMAGLSKVEYLKGYFSEPFSVDSNADFYSKKY